MDNQQPSSEQEKVQRLSRKGVGMLVVKAFRSGGHPEEG